ncbi:helix-turn-helix transcriptional regulator [Bombella sp. TMW 2.2559]|uniref:Helix-turn-helix transcriptional regulator n=1 Tax=Bombella dulcis TaxID=2967339 RepID=A0ABT3WC65_9PROT|nr:helix-turn-helix transcriptional regulator [Bombella dulcis]MCX5616546.1 helix-turn-helix transcriptional regulator [Bombella dulcis]
MLLSSSSLLPSGPPWHYWRASHPDVKEMSMAQGTTLALPLHFHQEDQLAFLLSGCRHFLIAGRSIRLTAGQALFIPAGTPHLSQDDDPAHVGQTLGLNLYLTPGLYTERADCAGLIRHYLGEREQPSHIHFASPPALPLPMQDGPFMESIQTLARQAKMSREAYSRRFQRHYGLAPQAFRLLQQLNHAKAQLRSGISSLQAAMDAGFADQSHMGRLFRRTFGTTPGRYREGPIPYEKP